MKLRETLTPKLPSYRKNIDSWDEWMRIKNSGMYDKDIVYGYFDCSNYNLTSLKGCPYEVQGNFICNNNDLTSFKGGPQIVYGYYDFNHTKISVLHGAPSLIEGDFYGEHSKLTSLEGIHKIIKKMRSINVRDNPIMSNILGLLLVKAIRQAKGSSPAFGIVDKHIKGDKDVLECQEELISAGYKRFAKL